MNHHRKRNHSSPEHRRSIKNLLQEKNLANRRLVLNARLQKMAAKGDIVPTKYLGGNPDTTIKMKTKEFLDKSSSSGMSESIGEGKPIQHNSGVISYLNKTHSGDPADNNYVRENTKKKKYYIDQDKDGNYTKDFHKYYKMKDTVGVNELDFIDENTEPTTYEGKTPTGWRGHDTRNKILGTGEDTTGYDRTGEEIFRGDEAGSTEYFKRKLRRGDSIERPYFSIGVDNKVTSHEGRHRSRALMEEGVEDVEVNIDERTDDSSRDRKIRGQEESLDSLKEKLDRMKRLETKSPLKFRNRAIGDVEVQPSDLKDRLDKIKEDTRAPIFGRFSKLKQKMAVRFSNSFGADLDAIDAFKRKEQYQGYVGKGKNRKLKFEVTGNELKLLGHTIATHTADGIEISNAGFDTPLTYNAFKELGIRAERIPDGRVKLHTTDIEGESGEKVMVPYNEVSDKPYRVPKKQTKQKNPNRTVTEQSKFRQNVEGKKTAPKKNEKGELPLSTVSIQPDDQRTINDITGVNTKIPPKRRATAAHHIFGVDSNPKLKNNPNNGIMLTRKEHTEVEKLNKGLLRKQAMLRLASIRSRIATFKQDIRTSNDMPENALNLSADSIMDKFEEFHKNNPDISKINGTFDPLKGEFVDASSPAGAMRLQNIFGAKGSLALNSITDTRQGPVTDINHIRSQLREIEQEGGIPSVGIFDGSLEATKVLRDWSDKDVLNDLLESQRSTAIIDPDTRLRIVDNVSFRQN